MLEEKRGEMGRVEKGVRRRGGGGGVLNTALLGICSMLTLTLMLLVANMANTK